MINPFVKNTRLEVINVSKVHNLQLQLDGSDKENASLKASGYLFDPQAKTSVYQSKETFNMLYSKDKLTTIGRDLLLYIIYNLKVDTDYISLKPTVICESLSISKKSYYNGINNLLLHSFIEKKHGARSNFEYWIDPFLLFNGNRINYFKKLGEPNEYIKIKGSSVKATASEVLVK